MILNNFLLFLSLIIIPGSLYAENNIIYFASFDETSRNGKIISSDISFNPVRLSLSSSNFKKYEWSVTTTNADKSEKELVLSGIRLFLLKNGSLSVNSGSKKFNSHLNDTVTSSFQGYFLNEVEIKKIIKKNKGSDIEVFFEGFYAPLSSPDKWEGIIFRDKIKAGLKYFKSFFQ
ncbi:MAG: hypothetical protein ACQEQS_05155 [Thermodesulfobacteriota bacterium]